MGSGDPLLLKAMVRVGPRLMGRYAWSLLTGTPRSIATDAAQLATRLDPPAKIEGVELIPPREPFLLAANHYQAPGLWIGWVAIAITAAVASTREPNLRETHWMVAAEWGQTGLGGRWMSAPGSRWLFLRAAAVWGGIALPPNPGDVRGRARALRQVMAHLGHRRGEEEGDGEPVAMFPEGAATVALGEARPGSGAFIHRVNSLGVRLLPVGVHDDEGALVIRFGAPFLLPPQPPAGEEADDWARREVMASIGRLLPEPLWGRYAEAIRVSRKP